MCGNNLLNAAIIGYRSRFGRGKDKRYFIAEGINRARLEVDQQVCCCFQHRLVDCKKEIRNTSKGCRERTHTHTHIGDTNTTLQQILAVHGK